MNNIYLIGGILTTLIAIIYYYPTFFYIFIFVLYSIILLLLAIFGTIYVHFLLTSKTNKIQSNHHETTNILYNATKSPIFVPPNPIQHSAQLPIIFGRTVDGFLLQIIEYTLRDFVTPWLCHIVRKPKMLMDILREDIWNGIIKLRDRAIKIDASKMIAVDMVLRTTVHLEKIRIAQSRAFETGTEPIFATATYLISDDKEMEFIQKLCEIMIIFLLPKCYSLSPLKNLLSEILSYKIFYPTIKMITSPDYINQKIVQFIETKLAVAAICKRSYEYAASFEDFLKIINNSQQTVDDLLSIRTTIINDIMQATVMQNLQRVNSGFDSDDCLHRKNVDDTINLTKSDRTASIKLKRYLQQLTFAKAQCEKNLTKLGWEGIYSNDLDLSMHDILSTVIGRRYLILFLEPLKASGLVGFYASVEELKNSTRNNYHQLGAEIFYTYIRAPLSDVKVEKQVRKKMESFLLGDQGPDIFYETQKDILKTLEEKYYSSFLLSEQYQHLKNAITTEDIKDISSSTTSSTSLSTYGLDKSYTTVVTTTENEVSIMDESNNLTNNNDLTNNSTYARNKLEQLQEKLDNKMQALDAIKSSLKPESKLLTILEKDVDWLKMEKRQMEAHLTRTEIWSEYLGKWRATVQSVEIPDEKEPPQFMILVQADNVININNSNNSNNNNCNNNNTHIENKENHVNNTDNISSGWVVLRPLNEFHELHRKLRPLCSDLRSFDLPTTAFKLFFLKNDKSSLEKAKAQIQKYLNFTLENDNLYQSEALYEFLSPSSEHLKNVQPSPKKSKFSLSTLFKNDANNREQNRGIDPFWGPCGPRGDGEEDISMFLEGIGPTNNTSSTTTTTTTTSMITTTSTATATTTTTTNITIIDNNFNNNNNTTTTITTTDKSGGEFDNGKDSIAEPLYTLMGEIFDMGGVFNWIRRRLISFVQLTYGRTINRQIRDTITYLYDEVMLQYYATTAIKSFWPGGVLASEYTERTDDMKEMTENAAKSLLIDNIPEVLCNLVGAQTAKQGAFKVFEILQNAIYNKQLFYELVEILMLELFPEIRQLKPEKYQKKNIVSK